ncbi:MAG: hypothetical protein ABIA75_09065 [Candidatus Neomarinimicrobiota bacterium]
MIRRTVQMRIRLLLTLLGLTILLGQPAVTVLERIDYPKHLKSGFRPALLTVGNNGAVYLLDRSARRLALIGTDGTVGYGGGFGRDLDAFFDPVALTANNLEILVCDRSENRLLRFDYLLNYIGAVTTGTATGDLLYPEQLAVDSWGELLLYSEVLDKIYKIAAATPTPLPQIDLDHLKLTAGCVGALASGPDGDAGILLTCRRELRLYNRFGRPAAVWPLQISGPELLVNYRGNWLVLNRQGQWQTVGRQAVSGSLPEIAGNITACAAYKDRLYLLTGETIFVVRIRIQP